MILNLRLLAFFLPLLIFLAYIFLSQKRLSRPWLVLAGIYPAVVVYGLNPSWRFYSFHGLLHASIVYQILEQGLPAAHPYLAGQTLCYSCGHHVLAAGVTQGLNLPPSSSFALINIVCLALVLHLVYRISGLLFKNEKANVFSVIMAVFALTIIPRGMPYLKAIEIAGAPLFSVELRGIPVFKKFINVNGVPLGLVFFLLFLHSIIRLFQGGGKRWTPYLLGGAVVGCGFFYSPFLPGLVAGAAGACGARCVLERRQGFLRCLMRMRWAVASLVGGGLIILPYFISTSSAAGSAVRFLDPGFTLSNLLGYLLACAPVLAVLYLGRGVLRERAERQALVVLCAVVVTNWACYVGLHLPSHNEYKFLILSTVPLGILGGLAFHAIAQRYDKRILFLVFLCFFLPLYDVMERRSKWFSRMPQQYAEKGKAICSLNEEENQMVQWIRKNTPPDSIFVDSEFTLPILARRPL